MAKVASTHFLQMLHRTEGFPVVVLRLFLTYGPGQSTDRFLPQIIAGCLGDREFPVSEGAQLRDFCYIDDVVEAILLSLITKNALGEIINISSGIPVTIRSIIENVTEIIGGGNPKFGAIPYRIGENMELFADIGKAKSLLGWKGCVHIRNSLKVTIDSLVKSLGAR